MQALILAGGQGTRLRPLTLNTPKPIVPIGNQPFLLKQIELLKTIGILDITLSLGYQPSAIENILGDGSDYGVNLRYLVEPTPIGTAGAYKFAERFLKTSTLVLNGDILTDIDLQVIAEQHKKYEATATIVLTNVENPFAYGMVEVDEDNKVLSFLEKPKHDDINKITINTINAGIYILEPKVLDYIPTNANYSFEYQLFPNLLQRNENFRAFIANDCYWLDIGTPQRYLQAHYDLVMGKIKNFQINKNKCFSVSPGAEIDDKSYIDTDCIIKSGVKVINSVIGKNVIIEEKTVIENSVIWAGTRINSYTNILNSIIGNNCFIGKHILLNNGSVLGDKTTITDFSHLC